MIKLHLSSILTLTFSDVTKQTPIVTYVDSSHSVQFSKKNSEVSAYLAAFLLYFAKSLTHRII